MVPLEETENACVSFAEEAVSPFSSYNLGATLMTFAIIMLSVGYGIYASCRAVRLATSDTTRRHRNRLTAVAGYATVSVVLLGGALFIGWTFCNQPEKILPNPYGMVMHYDEQSLKAKTLRKNNVRSIDSHYQITELDGWDGRLYQRLSSNLPHHFQERRCLAERKTRAGRQFWNPLCDRNRWYGIRVWDS